MCDRFAISTSRSTSKTSTICNLGHKFIEITEDISEMTEEGWIMTEVFLIRDLSNSLATEKQSGLLVERYNLFIDVCFVTLIYSGG